MMARTKSFIISVFISFLVLACAKDRPSDRILKQPEMIAILVDLHLTEGKVNRLYLAPDSASQVYQIMEDSVFSKHQVDSLTYYNSYQYYMDNVLKMDRIYNAVVDSLSLRKNAKQLD